MNEQIRAAYLAGKLVLFIGAGASRTSMTKNGTPILDGEGLAKRIAESAGWSYNQEPLGTVYAAARSTMGAQLDSLFSELFRHCTPSPEYIRLARYPWARIYTTNIDDALEIAFRSKSEQEVFVRHRDEGIASQDLIFKKLDLIKLNGSADSPDHGFIFSPQEYGRSSAQMPQWYRELGADFFQYTFIFIGTKLNEPIFYHQIEHYRSIVKAGAPRSYVLTPSASEIETASLNSVNLSHISASLHDFVAWLERELPSPPQVLDLAFSRNPSLKELFQKQSRADKEKYIDLLMDVTPVSRSHLFKATALVKSGTIRDFYRGFKPTWRDVLDEVPAYLESFHKFEDIVNGVTKPGTIIVLYGPAGCGKSTLLKQIGIRLSDNGAGNVYFLDEPNSNFAEIVDALETANDGRYYMLIDRLDSFRNELKEIFSRGSISKGIVIGCEGQNIWHSRLKVNIGDYCSVTFQLAEIGERDAEALLEKLETHGPWTRLSKLSKRQRIAELVEKSRRQLLIGLLETTYGVGFERLIAKDFESLSDTRKIFVVLVSLCTVHRQSAGESLISRALTLLDIDDYPDAVSADLSGIISKQPRGFSARHPVYARQILQSIVDMELMEASIRALLGAFSVFPHPVVMHLDRSQAVIFKSLINHKFLADVLRNDQKRVMDTYANFEKSFEKDGLYWLQYGLAMRDFGRQVEALDRLLTAFNAYPHDHTAHALAQQELIMALQDDVSSAKSSAYLSSAAERLEYLDKSINSDDTYPIVTLAEGHTQVILKTEGTSAARIIARNYCGRLEKRIRSRPDPRLSEAYTRLLRFSTTGVWAIESET